MTKRDKTTETTAIFSPLFYGKKEKSQMGFNRKTSSKPSKNLVLATIEKMCLNLKRQVSIVEVATELMDNGFICDEVDVRHRMQDVRKAHKKSGTTGSYTARSGFVATSKTSIIQWDKESSNPIEYFVGKATAKEVKRLSENV